MKYNHTPQARIDSRQHIDAPAFCDWLEHHAPQGQWTQELVEFWTQFFLQHSNSFSQALVIGGFIPSELRQPLWDIWGKGHPARRHVMRLKKESQNGWIPDSENPQWVSCGYLESCVLREQLRRHPENHADILRWLSPGQAEMLGPYAKSKAEAEGQAKGNLVRLNSRKSAQLPRKRA